MRAVARTLVERLAQLEPDTPVTVYMRSGRVVKGWVAGSELNPSDGVAVVIDDGSPPSSSLEEAPRAYLLASEIEGFDW